MTELSPLISVLTATFAWHGARITRISQFLIALIQRVVMEDIREAPILPYIRGIAEKVIVRKTLSHESGQKEMSKGFSTLQYMEEFSEVLEKILVRWEER